MPYHMYVSRQDDDKISIFTVDTTTGKLSPRGDVDVPGGPAPLAIDPERRFLYVGRRANREISSYRIEGATGKLLLVGTVLLDYDPCYLATDRNGKFVLSSYYEGGKAAVHEINDDGVATGPPIEWLDTARGAHSFQTDPTNRFAFVPHIAGNGPNAIFQFKFDQVSGRLTPNTPPQVSPDSEIGPRHFCFHPSQDVLYFSDEQGCSVSGYRLDPSAGTLTLFQTVSTLPDDFHGRNSCSQIQITPSGKFLYAPNRGHNSIACFSIDGATAQLTSLGQVPTEPVPRALSLDPAGNFLYVAGLESGRLASYRVDQDNGGLTSLETHRVGNRPMWVLVAQLPG